MMSASTGTSISRAVDRRPGRRRHRRDGADVVEVAVGEQDRLDLRPARLDRGEDPLRLLAGIDDQQPVGALGDAAGSSSRRSAPTVSISTSRRHGSLPLASAIRARSRRRHIVMSM